MLVAKQRRHASLRPIVLGFLTFGASLVLSGCDDNPNAESRELAANLPKRIVTVSGRRFDISLPAKAKVRYLGNAASIILDPNTRSPDVINLFPAAANSPKAKVTWKKIKFTSGAVLTYVIRKADAGNGGRQEFLVGRLRFNDTTLMVTCISKGKFATQGDWCIPYLGALRIKRP